MNGDVTVLVGWREWVALPDLDIPAIKAKVDTGARTSALHALDIEPIGDTRLAFTVQPLQRSDQVTRRCEAPLVDQRRVIDSGGHPEDRYVIETTLVVGPVRHLIEVTLTERPGMRFRMLIGRTSLAGLMQVDPARSFVQGRLAARRLYT